MPLHPHTPPRPADDTTATPKQPLSHEVEQVIRDMFENKIVFNQTLGLRIQNLGPEWVEAHIDMRPDLIGHYGHKRIHGGVISAGLDAMGGLAVVVSTAYHHYGEGSAALLQRFDRLGTIDLRVDYLRPGIGTSFILRAQCLRLGGRVANTRMEFCSSKGELLSTGTAAYIVS